MYVRVSRESSTTIGAIVSHHINDQTANIYEHLLSFRSNHKQNTNRFTEMSIAHNKLL